MTESNSPRMDAFLGIEPSLPRRQLDVYRIIVARGSRGATIHEIAFHLQDPKALNRFSGRLTELEEKGWIYRSGKRGGATIYQMGQGESKSRATRRPARGKIVGVDRAIPNNDGGFDCIVIMRVSRADHIPSKGQSVKW